MTITVATTVQNDECGNMIIQHQLIMMAAHADHSNHKLTSDLNLVLGMIFGATQCSRSRQKGER